MVRPAFQKDDFQPAAKRLGIATQVNTFWTDFEKGNPFFEVLDKQPESEFTDYWQFQTNIDFEDITLFWDDKRAKRFLYKMWEIYRYRKAE